MAVLAVNLLVCDQVRVDREDFSPIGSIITGFATDVIDRLFIRSSIVGADSVGVGDWR